MEIEPWLYAALTATGVLTGFIDAIAGGGGLIMMPALLSAGLPPHLALGTNKLQSAMGTGMSARTYRANGQYRITGNRLTARVADYAGPVEQHYRDAGHAAAEDTVAVRVHTLCMN